MSAGASDEMLIVGEFVPDVVDMVSACRMVIESPQPLPCGVYWFAGVSPAVARGQQGRTARGAGCGAGR